MAIIVDRDTRLVVQGLTGSEGLPRTAQQRLRHERRRRRHAREGRPGRRGDPGLRHGRRRGRGDGREHDDGVRARALRRGRDLRGGRRGHRDRHLHHRGHARARDAAGLQLHPRRAGVTMIGPNCPGVLSPGKANVGIIPAEIFREGSIGLVSRSGHADVPDRPRADAARPRQLDDRRHRRRPGRRLVLHRRPRALRGRRRDRVRRDGRRDRRRRGGEGGRVHRGRDDEARRRATSPASPRRPGKTMGHAGAIISGSSGTAQGEEGGARGEGRPRRHDADRGRPARRRDRTLEPRRRYRRR